MGYSSVSSVSRKHRTDNRSVRRNHPSVPDIQNRCCPSNPVGGVVMSMFVVAGATGHVGSVVALELLAAGHKVRAIVRSADKAKALAGKGAELLTGELSDASFLTHALRGADGAFLLVPPPPHDSPDVRAFQDRVAHVEATAVAESGVRHVVLLSSWGAEHPAGTGPIVGLHVLEEALKKTRALYTL